MTLRTGNHDTNTTATQLGNQGMHMIANVMNPTSQTGHLERRRHIRNLSTQELVYNHNLLVQSIIARGVIGVQEKSILLAMQQEGIESGGVFYRQIGEGDTQHSVSHTEGISQYNPTLGITEVIRGNSQLRLWEIISE